MAKSVKAFDGCWHDDKCVHVCYIYYVLSLLLDVASFLAATHLEAIMAMGPGSGGVSII